MNSSQHFPVIVKKFVAETEFIEFWSSQYSDPRDHLYSQNIGKPLDPRRLLELFQWKNGGPIAAFKRKSIEQNYIDVKPSPPKSGDREDHIRFITQPGGAIWRIFWLHCHAPEVYPIFDQHVFRAMSALVEGSPTEIPNTTSAKAQAYIDEYIPFYLGFSHKTKSNLMKRCGHMVSF